MYQETITYSSLLRTPSQIIQDCARGLQDDLQQHYDWVARRDEKWQVVTNDWNKALLKIIQRELETVSGYPELIGKYRWPDKEPARLFIDWHGGHDSYGGAEPTLVLPYSLQRPLQNVVTNRFWYHIALRFQDLINYYGIDPEPLETFVYAAGRVTEEDDFAKRLFLGNKCSEMWFQFLLPVFEAAECGGFCQASWSGEVRISENAVELSSYVEYTESYDCSTPEELYGVKVS